MSTFAQILREIGGFGLFQKLLVVALCIPCIFTAFDLIGQVFTSIEFPNHCDTDWILARGANLTRELQKNLTIPKDKDGRYESCRMFTPVDVDVESIEAGGINTTTGCINGSRFAVPEGSSSIVTEFNLVCDRSGLVQVSLAASMAGLLLGSLVLGQIADRFGRRKVVLFSLLLLLLSGAGAGVSPNIYVYILLKFLAGFSNSGILGNGFVIGGEWSDSSKFAFCTIVSHCFYSTGLMLVAGFAYLIRSWRILQLVLFCPLVVVLGLFYWLLPESARWLVTQGRKEEVARMVRRAAKVNGRKVPEELLEALEFKHQSNRGSLLDIFRTSYLRKRALILNYVWFANSLMYNGLSLNVGSFGVNIYLTQFIFGAVEIPSCMAACVSVQKLGRRKCEAGLLLFGGCACLMIVPVPKDLPVVITVIAVLGKCAVTASFSIIYVYTAELYPTTLRQNGVGLNSTFARFAGVFVPFINLLGIYHDAVPMLIYGTVPLVAGGLCFLLPETVNAELQDYADVM